MVKRAKRKAKKKAVKRAPRKKVVRKKRPKTKASSKAAHWIAYRELRQRVDKAWAKLQADVKRKAKPQILIQDKNHLMLLLGECNYMARECMRLAAKRKK